MNQWTQKIDMRIRQFGQLKTGNKDIFEAAALMERSLREGNKILVFGNGGSASQSSHFAAELVNKFYFQRGGLPAVALTTDTACLTSIGNDMGYRHVFSRQVEALGRPGDIAFGLTTSGKSPNVLDGLLVAQQLHLKTVVLCGASFPPPGSTGLLPDVVITVPAEDTPLIQEMHLFILHWLAEVLEGEIFKGAR